MLASIAGTLRQRNLSKAAALVALMEENNAKCEPPLSEEEVERIVESVWRYEAGPAYEPPVPAEDVFSADPTLEVPVAREKPEVYIETMVHDLANEEDDPVIWLVQDMLPMFGSSLFGAKPKVGKSTMARALAAAVAFGKPWLGYEVQQGSVIYFRFPGEGTRQEARQEWRALTGGAESGLVDIQVQNPQEILEHLDLLVDKHDPVLVVVDTLQHMIQVSDMKDYSAVHAALTPIHTLARRAHVMLLHHAKKGEVPDMADVYLGSTALFAATDVGLHLERDMEDQNIRYLQGRGRGIEIEQHVVKMDPDTHEPFLAGTAEQFQRDEMEARVLGVLAEYAEQGKLTQIELLDLVKGKTDKIKAALKALETAGSILRERMRDRNGSPYGYWLPDTEPFQAQEDSDAAE
jgi:hypothetical protein